MEIDFCPYKHGADESHFQGPIPTGTGNYMYVYSSKCRWEKSLFDLMTLRAHALFCVFFQIPPSRVSAKFSLCPPGATSIGKQQQARLIAVRPTEW